MHICCFIQYSIYQAKVCLLMAEQSILLRRPDFRHHSIVRPGFFEGIRNPSTGCKRLDLTF